MLTFVDHFCYGFHIPFLFIIVNVFDVCFLLHYFSGSAPLTAVQLLWVNMIMDTLGALALATEPPNNDLMKRPPVGKRQNFISNVMWRNILGQSFYQFTVIWLLQAKGESIFGLDGPDSHLILNTLIFNTFVFCQVSENLIPCFFKLVHDITIFKGNMIFFSGVQRNKLA